MAPARATCRANTLDTPKRLENVAFTTKTYDDAQADHDKDNTHVTHDNQHLGTLMLAPELIQKRTLENYA